MKSVSMKFAVSVFFLFSGILVRDLTTVAMDSSGSVVDAAAEDLDESAVSQESTSKIQVVFVLDTTGSMAGLINAAREKIWSISTTISRAQPAPEIEIGLVGYRDRGDEYVTKVVPLNRNLDSIYGELMQFKADGGNDAPESVNQALHESLHQIGWNSDKDVCRIIYLVGDAPPHMDYSDDISYRESCKKARELGILINTIQCGNMAETKPIWAEIADNGMGMYAQIEQQGGELAPETPFDKELAELSQKLDATRLYYGNLSVREAQCAKQDLEETIYDNASVRSIAQRAVFNCTSSGAWNFAGVQELVSDVTSGKKKVEEIKKEELPDELQVMSVEDLTVLIKAKHEEREKIQNQVGEIGRKREDWLKAELAKKGNEIPELDRIIFDSIRTQLKPFGMDLPESALSL